MYWILYRLFWIKRPGEKRERRRARGEEEGRGEERGRERADEESRDMRDEGEGRRHRGEESKETKEKRGHETDGWGSGEEERSSPPSPCFCFKR